MTTTTEQIDSLVSFVCVRPRTRELRAGIASRLQPLSPQEIASEGVDGVHQWLWATCHVFFQATPSDEVLVESLTESDWFGLAVVYIEVLANAWKSCDPSREERACLETIVELLARVEAKKEQPLSMVEGQLVVAYLLCAALWDGLRRRPLLEAEKEQEVFARNKLYAPLAAKANLGEVVEEVRLRCHL